MTEVIAIASCWCLAGMIGHHLGYARKTLNYDPTGYLLSCFPGPFTYWILKANRGLF